MTGTQSRPSEVSPLISAAAVRQLAGVELSLRSRLGYVALLLAASSMTVVILSLWLTEPALPRRTQLAFAVMSVIGTSWVAFALWALTHRRTLLARDSIVAGRMAVTFTSVFVIGAIAVGVATRAAAPFAAAALGFVMLAPAITLLVRAHRTFARLTERRQTLERELGREPK
jgi:hypothetical protein